MTSLRVIILAIGIVLIAIIYLWETIRQRRLQRKQTVSPAYSEQEYTGVRITADQDIQNDYADVLSELNQTLAETKRKGDVKTRDTITVTTAKGFGIDDYQNSDPRRKLETRDMFASFRHEPPAAARPGDSNYQNLDESQIIALHITALPTGIFNGNDILDAVNDVGLEFGEMNLFHHYGIGDMQSNRPLFSLSDMFEPGSFDLTRLDQHNTRGLTLFFCLPVRVDGQVVFELMLNTAQRLAKRLGGEIRGADHNLINDDQIAANRNKISHYSSA